MGPGPWVTKGLPAAEPKGGWWGPMAAIIPPGTRKILRLMPEHLGRVAGGWEAIMLGQGLLEDRDPPPCIGSSRAGPWAGPAAPESRPCPSSAA
jgi:hypothetical protein